MVVVVGVVVVGCVCGGGGGWGWGGGGGGGGGGRREASKAGGDNAATKQWGAVLLARALVSWGICLSGYHLGQIAVVKPHMQRQPTYQLQEKPEMNRQMVTRAATAVPLLSVLLELKPTPRMMQVAIWREQRDAGISTRASHCVAQRTRLACKQRRAARSRPGLDLQLLQRDMSVQPSNYRETATTERQPAAILACPEPIHTHTHTHTWLSSIWRPPSSSSGRRPTRSTSGMPTNVPATFTLPAPGFTQICFGFGRVGQPCRMRVGGEQLPGFSSGQLAWK